MNSRRRPIAKVFLPLFLLAIHLFAQLDTGTINVSVKDASSSAVPGATVVLRNERTGVNARSATTNELGSCIFALVPSGVYSVRVEHPGFKAFEQSGVVLQVNEQI